MAGTTLEMLLERIRDGVATVDEIDGARELARHDGRLPEEIRGEILGEDIEADAVALLAILAGDDFGEVLREALVDELDVADDVMAAIAASGPPLADAVRDEAGEIEVTSDTLAALGDLGLPIREAVVAEAGRIEVAHAVMTALRQDSLAISAAVQAEAGRVDIADQVCMALGISTPSVREAILDEAGAVPDIWTAVFDDISARETLVPEVPVVAFPPGATVAPVVANDGMPSAANNNRRWARYGFGALVMAAAALLVLGLSPGQSTITTIPTVNPDELVEVAQLVFASAGDVVVENLEYGDDVMVMQMMGDDGAMILWVDEGEVL